MPRCQKVNVTSSEKRKKHYRLDERPDRKKKNLSTTAGDDLSQARRGKTGEKKTAKNRKDHNEFLTGHLKKKKKKTAFPFPAHKAFAIRPKDSPGKERAPKKKVSGGYKVKGTDVSKSQLH